MQHFKIYNNLLVLFIILIFSVPIYWILRGEVEPEKSLVEGKVYSTFLPNFILDMKIAGKELLNGNPVKVGAFIGRFIDRNIQNNVELSAGDQFPFRLNGIQLTRLLDRKVIELAYLPTNDPVIPSDLRSGLFIVKNKPILISGPGEFDDTSIENIDLRIANYKQLIEKNPDIQFYVFYHQRLSYSEYHPLNSFYSNIDKGQGIKYFEKNIPEELELSKFMLTDFDDHEEYYFSTDHHWNVHGSLKAYEIIYKMISNNYPNISPILPHDKIIKLPGIKFLGTYARESLYPVEGDDFEVALIDLPKYKIIDSGKVVRFNHSKEYLSGTYSTEPYVDHYASYYGKGGKLIEYEFNTNSDRNLLIIGSSFALPLQPLLAYHYNHTYVVDLREYQDFSLKEFRSKYHIDDVLVIGDNPVAFKDPNWIINP